MNVDTFISTVMTSGRPFAVSEDRSLSERQRKAHRLCWEYNRTDPNDGERQQEHCFIRGIDAVIGKARYVRADLLREFCLM